MSIAFATRGVTTEGDPFSFPCVAVILDNDTIEMCPAVEYDAPYGVDRFPDLARLTMVK